MTGVLPKIQMTQLANLDYHQNQKELTSNGRTTIRK